MELSRRLLLLSFFLLASAAAFCSAAMFKAIGSTWDQSGFSCFFPPQFSDTVLSNLSIIRPYDDGTRQCGDYAAVHLTVSPGSESAYMIGGGLEGQYRLDLLLFERSERWISGIKYHDLFLDLVYRKSLYDLAIVSVRYQLEANRTDASGIAGNLTDLFTEIHASGGNESVVKSLRIEDILRSGFIEIDCGPSPDIFTLDTPFTDHRFNISWIILQKYVNITDQQLSILRQAVTYPGWFNGERLQYGWLYRTDVLCPHWVYRSCDSPFPVPRAPSAAVDTVFKDYCEDCRPGGACDSQCSMLFYPNEGEEDCPWREGKFDCTYAETEEVYGLVRRRRTVAKRDSLRRRRSPHHQEETD